MNLRFTNNFQKQYRKLPDKMQTQFSERLRLFIADPTAPQLRVHPLQGKLKGYWSINISGDIRALYRYDEDETIIFVLIGTHSQLFGK